MFDFSWAFIFSPISGLSGDCLPIEHINVKTNYSLSLELSHPHRNPPSSCVSVHCPCMSVCLYHLEHSFFLVYLYFCLQNCARVRHAALQLLYVYPIWQDPSLMSQINILRLRPITVVFKDSHTKTYRWLASFIHGRKKSWKKGWVSGCLCLVRLWCD